MPAASAARVDGGGLEDDELRSDVQRGVGRGDLHREFRQAPVTVGPTVAAEHLPQRGQVGGVDHLERIGLHALRPPGGVPMLTPWPSISASTRSGLIRIDDLRAAVAHLAPDLEFFGDDLDAAHVAAGVEDLARVDDRVGHRDQVGHVTTLRCRDSQHGEQQPPVGLRMSRRIVTVLSSGPRSIDA